LEHVAYRLLLRRPARRKLLRANLPGWSTGRLADAG
jgi:hypothetical protein